MRKCRDIRNLFFEAYGGELNPADKEAFDGHMQECGDCRKQYEEMSALLATMSQYERPEPGAIFWEGYWERLHPLLAAEKKKRFVLLDTIRDAAHSLIDRPLGGMRLAGLVTASVLVGVLLTWTLTGRNPFFTGGNGSGRYANENELLIRAGSFMTRSEVILLGFVNSDAGVRDNGQSNIALQKDYSAVLVGESDALIYDLAEGREYQLRQLIEELRFILMQIANLEENYRPEEIELIQDGVRRKALLFKLNVEAMKLGGSMENAGESVRRTNIRNNI